MGTLFNFETHTQPEARRQLILRWEDSPLQGFSSSESAFLAPRGRSVCGGGHVGGYRRVARLRRPGSLAYCRLNSPLESKVLDKRHTQMVERVVLAFGWLFDSTCWANVDQVSLWRGDD